MDGIFELCGLFEVEYIIEPINANLIEDVRLHLKTITSNSNDAREFEILTSQLVDIKELERILFNNYIIFVPKYVCLVQLYINEEILRCKKLNKIIYETGIIGWQKINAISNNYQFLLSPLTNNGVEVKYYDNFMKFKYGNEQGQIEFIKENIIPYKETRLAMTLGLASILASFIEQFKSIGTLVINVSGKSSTGKSTIAELSASFFASPETSNYGIVRTFNATKNFIFGMSEGRNGIPIILDDANANRNEHDKADLIYQFAMGEPRGRCNNVGSVQQKRVGWSGLVIITSESPILENEKVSSGALVRCITLDSVAWTQSAEHSDKIKEGVRANYGFIGEQFANYILTLNSHDILKLYEEHYKTIVKRMVKKDSLSNRIASKLAIISLTAHYIKEFNNEFSIDENEIIDMLINYEQSAFDERSVGDKVFEELIEFISMNLRNFCIYRKGNYNSSEDKRVFTEQFAGSKCYGMITRSLVDEGNVCILKPVFDDFLNKNHIKEGKSILKEWIQKDLIVGDKDHNTVKINREYVKGRCIKIKYSTINKYFPDNSEEIFGYGESNPHW